MDKHWVKVGDWGYNLAHLVCWEDVTDKADPDAPARVALYFDCLAHPVPAPPVLEGEAAESFLEHAGGGAHDATPADQKKEQHDRKQERDKRKRERRKAAQAAEAPAADDDAKRHAAAHHPKA